VLAAWPLSQSSNCPAAALVPKRKVEIMADGNTNMVMLCGGRVWLNTPLVKLWSAK